MNRNISSVRIRGVIRQVARTGSALAFHMRCTVRGARVWSDLFDRNQLAKGALGIRLRPEHVVNARSPNMRRPPAGPRRHSSWMRFALHHDSVVYGRALAE